MGRPAEARGGRSRLARVPYVYAFDHKHRRPPMDLKDLLGGKGANLAEMTSVLGLPVPPGFTITTDACRAYMAGGWPDGLDEEIAKQVFAPREEDGPQARRPVRPAARQRALRRQVLDARDDGHRPEPRPQRPEREGPGRRSRATSASPTTPTAASSPCTAASCSASSRTCSTSPFEKAKATAGVTSDAEIPADGLHELCEEYKRVVRSSHRRRLPAEAARAAPRRHRGRVQSWNGARAIAYRVRERISHDLGTAVNVQAMVFGNRDDNSGTGVGFTRNAATGENKPYGDFLVNAQGEDVVAGIRNTEDLDHLKLNFPAIHDELLDIFDRLELHYRDMCDTEFTIEQGKLWMLQTRVGKRTGAAALRMAVDMTKDKHIKLTRDEAVQRITADHLDQVLHPQFAGGDMQVIAKGLAASPGAAVGKAYFTADDAADAADRGEDGHPRAHRDQPRGRARHDGVEGHPHRPRRPGQPRRRGGPRLGHAGRRGRRGHHDRGQPVHRGRRRGARGRRHLPRRLHRRGRARRGAAGGGRAARRVRHDPRAGPTRSARASWPCGPTPTTAPTPPTPGSSAPRASGCAAPSTCSSARTACPWCAA